MGVTKEHPAGHLFLAAGLVARLFAGLEDNKSFIKTLHNVANTHEEELLQQVTSYFRRHHGRLHCKILEKELHYSADHLGRLVKRLTGMTLGAYGQIFALEEAAEYLKKTDLSIGSIMEKFDFSNRSYFNRIFISQYGMPPSQYRRKMKGE